MFADSMFSCLHKQKCTTVVHFCQINKIDLEIIAGPQGEGGLWLWFRSWPQSPSPINARATLSANFDSTHI
jgi:hypothetical protein